MRRFLPLLALAFVAGAPGRPIGADVLFWTQAQRDAGFGHMDRHYPTHAVPHGARPYPLPVGAPLSVAIPWKGSTLSLAQFMRAQHTAGLLVLDHGRIRLEVYGNGAGRDTRWTSFSVAKSVTSTLVGAAIRDGAISGLDESVTAIVPELRGSAYDGVTVRQVLTMTSGVAWNEDYSDPQSDVARLFLEPAAPGIDPTIAYLRRLKRAARPGTIWHYNTGETGLAGILVTRATHKSLAAYLSEKIWQPFGMAQEAYWGVGPGGQEPGGCCLSATLRDYGRFGLFMLGGGRAGDRNILPDDWVADATRATSQTDMPGRGYGFQWWTEASGIYDAIGIFGQAIHIDPKRQLVVVMTSAWPSAVGPDLIALRGALFDAVAVALDHGSARSRAGEPDR
jgi:CubicO group peptidase (beta-lactamase class C family)